MQKSKLKIWLVGLMIIGIASTGGWWVWNSWIKEKPPSEQALACEQKCKSLGYASGVCRTFPVLPNTTKCKEDEIDIGHTIDCQPPTKDKEPIGGGGWACCCKVKEIQEVTITTDKTEYEQGEIMTVTVANRTEASIFYSSSPFMLYKYKGGEWVASPYPWQRGLEVPQMEMEPLYEGFEEVQPLLIEIKANTDKKFIDAMNTKWITPGKYKVEFKYTLDRDNGEWKTIYSNEFMIIEKTSGEKTCNEKCRNLGYSAGVCEKYAISPEGMAQRCKEGEVDIGGATDCKLQPMVVGVGITCCCVKK